MKTAGWSTRRVASQVDRSECAVRNCWEQWTQESTHSWKTGSGANRKTTRREYRRIDCLDSEGIQRLVWPARSPDLNPIENVWDALGRQVSGRNYPPTNKNTPIRALTGEWDKLPQQLLDNVVQSMLRLVKKQRSAFDLVSEFDRGRIVAYRDCELSFREIGSRVGRNQTTVMRICDRWMQEDTTDRRGRLYPLQCTTSREDRQIVCMAVTDRSVTSRTIAQHIESVMHHSVSARTIRCRLQQSGLSSRRPLLGLPLTQNHRRLHCQWCDERRMWVAEWNEVVFTDESRICLHHRNGWIRVWRHRGQRMLNSCVMHRHTGPASGIKVWGGIGYHSRTLLVCLAGTLNSQHYIFKVLEPVVLPYLQGLATAIFQQDNARPHVARIVQRFFVNRQIKLFLWPARSPDLSPIENMWSMVA
ncbi:transposable element Tcb1 transposase [Trichonephila clavipes]|nr:transposable element Tcb1 transposase [Trichonephila clavipes]